MNQVVLVGRMTSNPNVIETENGKKYTVINLAVQRAFKNQDGIYETDFIRCILWNGIASNTCEFCKIGDVIGIKGRLQNRIYENNNEETQYITEVIADEVEFLSTKNSEGGAEYKESAPQVKKADVAELEPVDDDSLPF